MSENPEGCTCAWGAGRFDPCEVCQATAYDPKFYLCFLDFETTGLDPQRHEPIEVAALVTDDQLTELGRFESLIIASSAVTDWDPFCVDLHAKNGLLGLLSQLEERSPVAARARVGDLLSRWLSDVIPTPNAQIHLAGNSVHFDRGFLRAYFPAIERRFHHRHLDVSSLRLAGQTFTDAAPLGGEKPHRAMADVLRSIEELQYWRAALREP